MVAMKPLTVSKLAIGDLKALLKASECVPKVELVCLVFCWLWISCKTICSIESFAEVEYCPRMYIPSASMGEYDSVPANQNQANSRNVSFWQFDWAADAFFCSGPRSSWKAGFSQRHRENQLSGFGCRANQLAGLRFGKNKLPGFDWRQEQLPVLSKVRNVQNGLRSQSEPNFEGTTALYQLMTAGGEAATSTGSFFAKLENLQLPFVLDQNISFWFHRFFTLFSKLFNLYKNDSG